MKPRQRFLIIITFRGVHFHQDKNFLKKLVRLKRDGMCGNNVECKEKEQEHLQKRHSFSPHVPTRRFNYLKEKLSKESCIHTSILSAIRCRMEAIPMLGKSVKHHKAHQIKRYVFICWCIYYALLTLILSTLLDINKVTEMSYRLKVSFFVTSILIEGASQNIGVPYRYLHVLEENKNKYNAFLLVNISTAIFLVLSWQCVSLTYKVFYCQIFKIALILYFETLDKAFPGNIKLKNIKGNIKDTYR